MPNTHKQRMMLTTYLLHQLTLITFHFHSIVGHKRQGKLLVSIRPKVQLLYFPQGTDKRSLENQYNW